MSAAGIASSRPSFRQWLAARGLDGVTLLVLPAVLFLLVLFVYPFLYGLVLSFEPKEGGWLANYRTLLLRPVPLRHDRDDALAGGPGDPLQPGARAADRLPRAAACGASAC